MQKCSYCGLDNEDAQATCRECGTELLAAACCTGPSVPKRQFCIIIVVLVAVVAAAIVLLRSSDKPHSVFFDSVEIKGKADFTERVVSALTLLKAKSRGAYAVVTNQIGVITQSDRSGMAAYETPPNSYLRADAQESTTSLGSGIAHESIHSKLYHDYLKQHPLSPSVPDDVWTGEAAEKQCCEHQVRVLQEINAPLSEIEYYTWNPSNRYWEIPYEKRNW